MAKKITETSTDYDNPYRPLPIKLLNAVGPLLGLTRKLSADALLKSARNKAGLNDFGDEWFIEPLSILVDSINKEAHLTALGMLIQKGRLVDALVTRLRIEALYKQHPEILDIDLGKLLIIAGLQRTGTTTLHRLLAADPDMRSLASWEAQFPVPLPGEKTGEPTGRMKKTHFMEKGLAYLSPEFFAIHPVEHDAPEEDILLLDLSFMSQTPEAIMHVPSYAAWLEKADSTPAYEYLKKVLKVLHWQRPAKNWVLKTPHHMEYLETLVKVFPEAKIIQTHRDPQKTMGSFCSMVAHGRGIFSDDVDAMEVANHWTRKVDRMIRHTLQAREKMPAGQSIDVSYYDIIKDPLNEIKRIYAMAGIEFTPAVEAQVKATMAANKQHRYGRHVYHLESFGLTKASIDEQFGYYREKHQIPHE